jgi:3D (Asp-Asp-Asp) domain-containing protein
MRDLMTKFAVLPNAGRPRIAAASLPRLLLAVGLLVAATALASPAPAAATETSASVRGRTVRMLVTAYCACTKCCGPNAQGITASGKPVTHNQGRFVAADKSILKLGQKLVVPGYHSGRPVEVLDTGSAIKGNRLDVYFPSHQRALEWGRQWLDVTIVDRD